MRVFIAIELDSPNLRKIQKGFDIKGVKLAKVLHLTLKFFGEIDNVLVEKLKEKLNEIKFDSFEIETGDIGVFPEEGDRINVIWIDLKSDKILELQKLIDEKLKDLAPNNDRFTLHLTIGRVKFVPDRKLLMDKIKNTEVVKENFMVKEFKLIESVLVGEGHAYKDLAKFKLEWSH